MSETRDAGAVCPNCSTPVTGPYCAQCGQRQGIARASLWRILADALEDQLNVNAALPRTLKLLLIHPGELTREYFQQRIVRYIPPVRLYLVSSITFFLLLSFLAGNDPVQFAGDGMAAADSAEVAALQAADSMVTRASGPRTEGTGRTEPGGFRMNLDDDGAPVDVNLGNERLNRWFEKRIETLRQMPREQVGREVRKGFFENAPKVMFVLLPFFALLLKIFYFRRYYVEHFIFALHLHAFAFAIFTIVLILPDVIPYVSGVLLAWIPIYTLLAMKRVYGQGLFRTVVKWWTLGVAYSVLLVFGIVGAVLVTLAMV